MKTELEPPAQGNDRGQDGIIFHRSAIPFDAITTLPMVQDLAREQASQYATNLHFTIADRGSQARPALTSRFPL